MNVRVKVSHHVYVKSHFVLKKTHTHAHTQPTHCVTRLLKRSVTSMTVLLILRRNTGRVVCCPLVSHVQYAPRVRLTFEQKMGQTDKGTDERTDGRQFRQTDALRLPLDAATVKK